MAIFLQLDLDKDKRMLIRAPDGAFLDVVPDKNSKPVYFKAPISCKE
jgi:hypothetical protein